MLTRATCTANMTFAEDKNACDGNDAANNLNGPHDAMHIMSLKT